MNKYITYPYLSVWAPAKGEAKGLIKEDNKNVIFNILMVKFLYFLYLIIS